MQLKQHLDLRKLNIETTVDTVPLGKCLGNAGTPGCKQRLGKFRNLLQKNVSNVFSELLISLKK